MYEQEQTSAKSYAPQRIAEVDRQSEIDREMAGMTIDIECLHKATADLEKRLSPILRNDDAKIGGEASLSTPICTMFANSLNDKRRDIQRAVRLLSSISVRLEL